jgi:hypothetical protein
MIVGDNLPAWTYLVIVLVCSFIMMRKVFPSLSGISAFFFMLDGSNVVIFFTEYTFLLQGSRQFVTLVISAYPSGPSYSAASFQKYMSSSEQFNTFSCFWEQLGNCASKLAVAQAEKVVPSALH